MITLNQLGQRICIIGCSNSGKSTLADNLSKKLNIPTFHLDQFAHIKNTQWQRQSDEQLIAEHYKIIEQDAWIIEGNYSICMQSRFKQATSVISLDPNVFTSVWRYLLRSIKDDPNRPGRLAGAQNEFSLGLVKWIIFNYPKNKLKYIKLLQNQSHLVILHLKSMSELNNYYTFWHLC